MATNVSDVSKVVWGIKQAQAAPAVDSPYVFAVDQAGNITTLGQTALGVQNTTAQAAPATLPGQTVLEMQTKVTLTAAQLLALYTNAQVLVPAPGAGLITLVKRIAAKFIFNTTAFTVGSMTMQVYYGPVANAKTLCGSFSSLLASTANAYQAPVLTSAGALTVAQTENQPILLGAGAANPTLGDGTLEVVVDYEYVKM